MIVTEHIRIDPAYRERLAASGLDRVRSVLERVAGRVAAWSRTTDTLYVPGNDDLPGWYIKRHFHRGWIKRLRGTFRGTFFGAHRAQTEYQALSMMRDLGLPAVRAVAYGGRRVLHFLEACFLITEEVPGAINLTTFAQQVQSGHRRLSCAERIELLNALAEQLVCLHASGFSHGNLFWRNVLVRYGLDQRPEFFFLDVAPQTWRERMAPVSVRWQRELAQTAVSAVPFTTRTERLRFVRRYLNARRLNEAARRQVREIDGLAKGWHAHENRRLQMNRLFEAWNARLAEEAGSSDPAVRALYPQGVRS